MSFNSDLMVMDEMADCDMDIRCSTTMVSAQSCSQGGHVTMGVDADSLLKLFTGESVAVLYIVNKKEFFGIKKANKEAS
ncbi:hypothetical protein [Fibrisoma montanum]|uniref:hypothetical protein n=1 Tax=Fibrisoma montanum TaxID=2305895 RepID=UPI0011C23D29|nr:hypothetical protein [Fibrisoma montanum]